MNSARYALVFLILAACATAPTDMVTSWTARAEANSGFSGASANIAATTNRAGTAVTVAFRDAPGMTGTVRPWHVHYGQCGNDQGIVGDANLYPPLRPGSDGAARATATIPVTLSSDRSYFVNIHKSPSELNTIVACGPLVAGATTSGTSTY